MFGRALVLALAIQTLVCSPVAEEKFDYSQHKLVRILPRESAHLDRLNQLKEEFDMKVDYWNHPMADLRPVLSLVSPQGMDFLNALNSSHIGYEIASNSFQKLIDREMEENERNRELTRDTKAFDYDTVYHSYAEISTQLQALPSSYSNAKYFSVGTTYEKRTIPGLTISSGSGRKKIFIECGIHAREWVSTASCLWIANQLLTTTDSSYLSKYDFIIVPTLNSDGYVYTWSTNRLWRKTRSLYSGCYGADPNRNWDASFCSAGASSNPCSDTYCGQKAFSEVEAKAMADLIAANSGNIAAYFSIHSYSQLWMYPYGYKTASPSNSAKLSTVSAAAVKAIKAANGLTFTAGTIANTIYIASGSSIDWAYDTHGVSIAFALELRDTGTYGFQLPASQIKAASTETWAGIKAAIDAL